MLQRSGRLAEAEAVYRQILKTQRNHFEGLHLLGVIEAQRGDHAAALEHIDAALNLRPDSADVLNNRGMILQGLGRLDDALASFDEALSRDGASAGTLFNRGAVLTRLARFDEALASFDKAIALKPDYLEALHDRGYVLFELKRVNEALASFDSAIALNPGYARAFNSRGLVLRAMGRLDDALASFEKAIALVPGNAGALFNRGLVLAQQGRLDEALANHDKALALQPNSVGYSCRSVILKDLGQLEAALESCDKALALDARNYEARNNRGNVLTAMSRLDEALAEYDRGLLIKPDYAEAYYNRGIALLQLERYDDALASYDRAISIEPTHSRAWNNRGFVLARLSRPDEALASYDRAIALRPDYSKAFFNRAVTFAELKRLDEALESYDCAIDIEPSCAAFNNRGVVLKELGRLHEALASYDRALKLEPGNPEAYSNRGVALRERGRNTEALREFDKAIELRADYSEAYNNRGTSLMALKRIDDALASYDRALEANAANAEAYKNRGICRLLAGRLSEGWADYEWRWKTKELLGRRPAIRAEEWQGQNLAGKRLALYSEQGLGDIIQFARYVPRLVALGANVTLLVRSPMSRLLKPLTKRVNVTNKVPPDEAFDYSCALLSIPRWLTTHDIASSVPYLGAEEELVARWKERVGTHGFKIGIAWQGSPHGKIDSGRSIPLSSFVPLARIPGVRLISLQKEHGLEQLADVPEDVKIELLGADFDSGPDAFIDTAAVMMNLDLIITSDTSIAHLAGALARPTWVALKYVPDWRWLLDRADSPWYPTMRLFRQKTDGDWKTVFENIESELSRTIAAIARELQILPELGITPTQSRAVTATARRPGTTDDAFAAGLALYKAGQLREAETIFRTILKGDAENFHALHSLGLIAQQRGNSGEALHLLDAALAINPSSAGALYNRAVILVQANCWDQALESLDKAIALDPSRAVVWSDRGVALKRLMRLEEALESYDQAVALDPSFAEAFSNRGNILKALGRFDEALRSYDKSISLKPNYADAVKNRGMCKLLCGDLATGWDDYEARWDASDNRTARPAIDAPVWQGEGLNGKSIIVHAEQGLGDAIQFSRYLPLLVQRNARVTFLVRSILAKLLEPVTSATRVIFSHAPTERYDFQCGLMSIPRWLSRDLAHIPDRVPYLTPNENLVAQWKSRLGERGFRIGIAWQGSPGASIDQGRSIPLKEFVPLARIPGVRLISLQKEHGLGQLADIPLDVTIEQLGGDLDNGSDAFLDTAAVMTNLDLIITSDTSIAHLAGALGCRTWVLLKSVPDWRWMLNREDSPWYPTMRVFRQDKAGDWASVFAKVNVQLLSLINKPHHDPKPPLAAPGVLSRDATLHFERAARLHSLGQLEQANQEYNLVLQLEPHNFEALHRKGVIAFQGGNLDEALALISAALSINPLSAEAFNNHGLVLMSSKRPTEALESFERAIALDPSLVEAFYNRGIALVDLQRLDEALQNFDHALTLKPDHIEALNHRGNALLTLERYADALETFDHALRLDSGRAKIHNNRGLALNELGRLGESIESFDRAILLQPNYGKAFKNRGSVLMSLGRNSDALASCQRAVELDANDSDAFVVQGNVLKELKRFGEAQSCFNKAIMLNPANPQAFNGRANTLVEQVRLSEAIRSFDQAVSLKPGYAAAIFSRGVCKLLAGNYSEGWEDYEARWDISKNPTKRPPIRGAIWRGENLSGRRIAVHCEQGLGDIIQFVRYLPLLVGQGAQVTFAVLPKLARVLKKAVNGTRVAEKIESTETFDYVSPLISLPLWLSRDIETVPKRVPYLEAETALISRWKKHIGEHGFRVGIAWQGSRGLIDVGRSIPASHFARLARIPGVRLISLQKEDGADLGAISSEIECLPKDFDGGDDAFVDTAAVMSCLDLVITSDTSIAHLAGALAKPTWVALKHLPDWRWMLDREDSPWYPTMRLFRQHSPGDWEGVFSKIEQELTPLARQRGGATSQKENETLIAPLPPRSEITESYERGVALHQAGRLNEAETAYDTVLRLRPEHFDSLHLKGVIALQRGNSELAVRNFAAALRVRPKSPEALNNQGLALTRLNRLSEALECFDRAIAIDSTSGEFFLNRGNALMALDSLDEALTSLDQALTLNSSYAEAHNQRGNALIKLKRYEEALASFDKAIAINPTYAKALNNRAIALKELDRSNEALESCNRAIAIDPNYAKALSNRGNTLKDLGRLEEALADLDRAISLDPRSPEAHITRGVILKESCRIDDAIASYDRALSLRPDYADALKNRGMALLSAGKYREGWKDYDWRWETSDFPAKRPEVDAPLWMGQSISGKRIAVYVEQGNGDIIQFSRYLPLLVRSGAKVTLLCPLRLKRLLAPVTKNVRVVSSIARSEKFEFHCGLMSLPRWFDTTAESVPSEVPYLTAEDDLIARWKAKIGQQGFKVGIAWQGSPLGKIDNGRSMPLSEFTSLARIPGVRLISLQKEHGLDQIAALPKDVSIELLEDFDTGPDAFVDTAAVMANLDLVITSDTSIAHLAGALGRQTWLALKRVPDWRWMRERQDCPWYPTMRLFRQRSSGDWGSVFLAIERELGALVGGSVQPNSTAADPTVIPLSAQHLHERAVAFHQTGRLSDAETTYQEVVRHQPDHFAALQQLGVIALQRGQHDLAVQRLDYALTVNPNSAEAQNSRGLALMASKRLAEALDSFDSVIALNPSSVESIYNRGSVLIQLQRLEDAVAAFDQAIALKPDYVEALNSRGNVLITLERYDEALKCFDQALAIRSDDEKVLNNQGIALKELGRFEEAVVSYDKAIALNPKYAKALKNRGNALFALNRLDEAIVSFDLAIAHNPNDSGAHYLRGNALKERKRTQEALASYDRAIQLNPVDAHAYNSRGNALMELGRLDDSIASYDSAIQLLPQYWSAIYNRGLCKLLDGNYREGWADYEGRWEVKTYPIKRPNFDARVWGGEDIAGRRIVVYSEQGLGDVIQFSRYLPLLADRGADITFAVLPKMERVLKKLTAGIRVVGMIDYRKRFDYSCALLSLPLRMGTNDVDSVPNQIPYLEPDDGLVAKWKERLGDHGFKVGIAWQGSPEGKVDRDRSIPLMEFAPLSRIPGIRLISLQKEHGLTQLSRVPEDVKIELLGDDFDGGPDAFVDTAAVMASLDLVITSDTSIAHLAGALGCPTWLALKRVPDWRWMLEREDSPWYPTMRLFRQDVDGDWQSVFRRIEGELRSMIKLTKGEEPTLEPATPVHSPTVPVSWGELMDKISILEIKRQKFTSTEATANVQRELAALEHVTREIVSNTALAPLRAQLKQVNETLWDIEDRIRAKEANKSFDSEFVELARAVYLNNDKRGSLKRQINRITSSELVEEKQYTAYSAEVHEVGHTASAASQPPLFENANLRVKKCRHGAMMFHSNDLYIGRSLDLYGEFSEGEIELFRQFIHPGMTVVDVGANIGAHTLYFSEAVGNTGRVIAFEPQQVLYQILCGNTALNLLRNVTPVNAGLGSVSGSITVPMIDYAQGGNFGGVALGRRKSGHEVPLRTLDSYELDACHLIKIDVEGMERDVLEGAVATLKRHEPILYVENDRVEKSKDLIQWLFDRDYRAYWHTPALFNPKNHFALKENVFGKVISINMLCIPRSKAIVAKGFREITSVDATWQTGAVKNSVKNST
jgi:FkbM family methyltransferase